MARIFISYRRAKSTRSARDLRRFCIDRFGRGSVFLDAESIRQGEVFPQRIIEAASSCEVFLPIISPDWHSLADVHGLRLHQEGDWVRQEIELVLRRKHNGEPVLIIPLIEAGASQVDASQLPDVLKSLADHNSVLFADEKDLELIASAIDDHLGSPPMGDFGFRALVQQADLSRCREHRFRYIRNRSDLEPFVTLSDAEGAIAETNPALFGATREALYDRWCQWTARDEFSPWHHPDNRVKSFLTLDQLQPDGTWLTISVSILLPLTLEGARHLRLMRKGEYLLPEKRNAATLDSRDLARQDCNRLLIDTWIVRRRLRSDDRVVRFEHYHWAQALLLRHLAEFWDPDTPTGFTFLCEPDNPKIAAMLNDLWFFEENRNAASGNLFVLKYPLDAEKYSPGDEDGIERIKDQIRDIKKIPILGSLPGGNSKLR